MVESNDDVSIKIETHCSTGYGDRYMYRVVRVRMYLELFLCAEMVRDYLRKMGTYRIRKCGDLVVCISESLRVVLELALGVLRWHTGHICPWYVPDRQWAIVCHLHDQGEWDTDTLLYLATHFGDLVSGAKVRRHYDDLRWLFRTCEYDSFDIGHY